MYCDVLQALVAQRAAFFQMRGRPHAITAYLFARRKSSHAIIPFHHAVPLCYYVMWPIMYLRPTSTRKSCVRPAAEDELKPQPVSERGRDIAYLQQSPPIIIEISPSYYKYLRVKGVRLAGFILVMSSRIESLRTEAAISANPSSIDRSCDPTTAPRSGASAAKLQCKIAASQPQPLAASEFGIFAARKHRCVVAFTSHNSPAPNPALKERQSPNPLSSTTQIPQLSRCSQDIGRPRWQ